MIDKSRVTDDIRSAYKRIDDPNYGFVQERYDSGFNGDVVHALRTVLDSVKEDTDLNYDVCRSLVVRQGEHVWLVQLSLVGRYGVVMGSLPGNLASRPLCEGLTVVEDVLRRNDIVILDESLLCDTLHFGQDGMQCLYYNVLFSTEDLPPWMQEPQAF